MLLKNTFRCSKRIKRTSSAGTAENELTINDLDDDSLSIIFNKMPYPDRVRIESVCKRWRDVGEVNWGTYSKHLNIYKDMDLFLPLHKSTPERNRNRLEKILQRRGRYLEKITFSHRIDLHQCFKVGTISRIVECCPKLKHLNIGSQALNFEDWYACYNIEGLSLSMTSYGADLRELFHRNKRLRRLQIYWTDTNASDFDHLDPGQLEILHIICCLNFEFTAELIDKLAESLVKLLYVSNPEGTGDLHHVGKLKNLRSLFIMFKCSRLKATLIDDIARNCQKLECISLFIKVTDVSNINFITLLFNLPCLKNLIIVMNKYELTLEERDRFIQKASNLHLFVLSWCAACTYNGDSINPCDKHIIHKNGVVSHPNEPDIIIHNIKEYKERNKCRC